MDKIPLNLLFSRLNSPTSLSLSLYVRCSDTRTIFVALHWTHSSMSMSLLYWGAQHQMQHSWWVSRWTEVKDRLPWSAGNTPPNIAPEVVGLFLLQRHIASLRASCCPPGPLCLLQQSCFPATCSPAFTGACGYASTGTELGNSLCWASWSSVCPFLQPLEVPLKGSTTLWSLK